jgi:hypothetical protein
VSDTFKIRLLENRSISAAVGMNEPEALYIPPRPAVAIEEQVRVRQTKLRVCAGRVSVHKTTRHTGFPVDDENRTSNQKSLTHEEVVFLFILEEKAVCQKTVVDSRSIGARESSSQPDKYSSLPTYRRSPPSPWAVSTMERVVGGVYAGLTKQMRLAGPFPRHA